MVMCIIMVCVRSNVLSFTWALIIACRTRPNVWLAYIKTLYCKTDTDVRTTKSKCDSGSGRWDTVSKATQIRSVATTSKQLTMVSHKKLLIYVFWTSYIIIYSHHLSPKQLLTSTEKQLNGTKRTSWPEVMCTGTRNAYRKKWRLWVT